MPAGRLLPGTRRRAGLSSPSQTSLPPGWNGSADMEGRRGAPTGPRVTRRGILVGGALGGGLLVAWAIAPRRFAPPLPAREDETAFGAWLRIARDGTVTVALPQLEMGQGASTVLAQIVATELGADWRLVTFAPVPVTGEFANVPLAGKWAPLWMPFLPRLAEGEDA